MKTSPPYTRKRFAALILASCVVTSTAIAQVAPTTNAACDIVRNSANSGRDRANQRISSIASSVSTATNTSISCQLQIGQLISRSLAILGASWLAIAGSAISNAVTNAACNSLGNALAANPLGRIGDDLGRAIDDAISGAGATGGNVGQPTYPPGTLQPGTIPGATPYGTGGVPGGSDPGGYALPQVPPPVVSAPSNNDGLPQWMFPNRPGTTTPAPAQPPVWTNGGANPPVYDPSGSSLDSGNRLKSGAPASQTSMMDRLACSLMGKC